MGVDKCKSIDVDGQNLTWVQAKTVRRGFFSHEERRLHHFRHHGKCKVPIGLVREYYSVFGSPSTYCPTTGSLGGDHVTSIQATKLMRFPHIVCDQGYELANSPRCLFDTPYMGVV